MEKEKELEERIAALENFVIEVHQITIELSDKIKKIEDKIGLEVDKK